MAVCTLFEGTIPVTLKQIANGIMTADSAAKLVGTGGQVAYLELTNNTIHASPVSVRFYETGPDGEKDLCVSTMLMTPGIGTKRVFKQTVFGSTIAWRCEVSTAADVDVAHVLCRLFA
ncbi:hypothetical protein [Pseudomonas sp. Sample_16]|uniref:hypothetical protein n=1 Tax=Pseudomonas sp. Sample_16 TaxID=2448263 RepID=UPI001032A7E2|nr:hypothetical protein [Pseudomonas sp. Sample_16]